MLCLVFLPENGSVPRTVCQDRRDLPADDRQRGEEIRMKITSIIFDIGRVLNGFGWERFLRRIVPEQTAYEAVEQAIFLNPIWVEHDKGLLTEEQELAEFIAEAPAYEKEIRAVYENLGECAWILDYAIPWVQELKEKGYRVYALSNWPEHIYKQRGHNLDFLDLMDGFCLSYQEHINKPDPGAFQNLMEKYDIKAEEAVFLDDTPANIEAAKKLGMQGILFRDYETARKELEKLGVK